MPLRTTMNYQQVPRKACAEIVLTNSKGIGMAALQSSPSRSYGMMEASQGASSAWLSPPSELTIFLRYYHGLLPALIQGPIARFGDTAANVGILALLSSNPFLNKLPSPLKTVFASIAGALFRMILVPIDTLKTTMQTQGKHGVGILRERIKAYGLGSLWWGAIATAVANFVGSFPWFATVRGSAM